MPNFHKYFKSEQLELKFKFAKEKQFENLFYEERGIWVDKEEVLLLKDCMRIVENLKTKTPIAILKEEAESYSKRLEIQLKEFQDDILPNKNLKLKEHIAHIYKLNSDMKQLENELFETKDKLKENETEIAKLQEIFNSQNQLKLWEIGTMTNPVAFKDLKKPKWAIKKGIAIKRKPSMRVSAFSNNLNLYPNFAQPPAMKNRSSVKNPISTSSKKIVRTSFSKLIILIRSYKSN